MAWYDFFLKKDVAAEAVTELEPHYEKHEPIERLTPAPQAWAGSDYGFGAGNIPPTVRLIYNGEKTFGELGPVVKHIMDHSRLTQRAWQLDIESETAHTIIQEKNKWVIGNGLRLECQPRTKVLTLNGIKLSSGQIETFNENIQELWENQSLKSNCMDYAKRTSLLKLSKRAKKNASMGDVLCVLRVGDDNIVNLQLIDGAHVCTPIGLGTITYQERLVDNQLGMDFVYSQTGNRVRNGVEILESGEHAAYWVRTGIGATWERIKAKNSLGFSVAYLVYGKEFRLDNTRAIPELTQSMQSVKQIDDFTEATVTGERERARVVMQITHERGTEETDPRQAQIAKLRGSRPEFASMDALDGTVYTADGKQIADKMAVSMPNQVYNMPAGGKVEPVDSGDQAKDYGSFFSPRINAVAASAGIPPEFAFQAFNGSYSASRGVANTFQFSLNIERDDFGTQFMMPPFYLQFHLWVLTGKVQAPGYLDAFNSGNTEVVNAYRFVNWVGDPIPEIDEYKSVMAKRLLLGTAMQHAPMATLEKVTRDLGNGNSLSNTIQVGRELTECDKEKIPREDEMTLDNSTGKNAQKGKGGAKKQRGKNP